MKRTDGTKMQNVYNNIYSGLMMGKKPFDPRKPVNEE
jgi:hypothetical protein